MGIFFTGGGEPISSLAMDFTALAALNFFFRFFTLSGENYFIAPASEFSTLFLESSSSDCV